MSAGVAVMAGNELMMRRALRLAQQLARRRTAGTAVCGQRRPPLPASQQRVGTLLGCNVLPLARFPQNHVSFSSLRYV